MARDYTKAPFCLKEKDLKWVEDTIAKMSEEEKLNQVFVDMLWNDTPKEVAASQKKNQFGGFRYNNMETEKVYEQNMTIQKHSKIPALIAANIEGGGNGAVKGGTKIGDEIAIAATGHIENAYALGYYGCKEAAAVGCNWTFAPITDIDFNWRNCVIGTRAFGNDVDTVADYAVEYMKGAHDAGVAACMKHFPGDGMDERDQHLCTTINDLSCEDWDASFGKVYKKMIDAGVPSVMIGHIALPSYTKKFNPQIADEDIMPATVQPEILQNLLRDQLGFNGLVITDATHMVGITSRMRRHDFIPKMLMSGCDMILYYRDHDEDIAYLKEALADGRLTRERLDEAVRTILAFKAYLHLHEKQKEGKLMPPEDGLSVIGCQEHINAAKRVIDESITLVKNTKDQLPLSPKEQKRIIIYPVQKTSLKDKIMGKKKKASDLLADALLEAGFDVTIYKMKPLKYLSPKGVNGKKALAEVSVTEFCSMYDAAIVLCDVGDFSTTNERALHWKIPMGPEIPWYASEIPTIGISVAHPFHLLDLPMVPTYINTYNGSKETMRQLVDKLTGKSAFKGTSPVDAFCDRVDTRY